MESPKRTHGLIILVFTFQLPHPVLLFPKNLSEGGSQEKIANQSKWTELVFKFQQSHCFAQSHLINTARSLLSHSPFPCWPPAGLTQTKLDHYPWPDAFLSHICQPLLLTLLSSLAKLTYFYPLSKPSPVPMATYWGSSVTMGTWLLGLNTPYHHSIKKYGERGSLVVRETEFRSSPWEMCWGKGCAVGSLESMPHPIWVLLGWPHTHCADTMVCVCVWNCLSILNIWRTSLEGTLGISRVSEETLISQLEGTGITWSPSLSYSLTHTDITAGHLPCQEDGNSIIPGKPSQKRDLSTKQKA